MSPEALAEKVRSEALETGVTLPPTQDELLYDDGVPMESERHRLQMELLIHSLKPWLDRRGEGYVGGNMFVYFSMEQVRGRDFRGPDVFVVLGVPQHERKSWVVWEETKGPDLVIELLSESTAEQDKSTKKAIYREQLRVPEYVWFDPFDPDDFVGFRLLDGDYEPLPLDAEGRLPCPRLGLVLVRWWGVFSGVETVWLRWATPEGELLLTPEETARQQAERERQRAERLAARLRELGVDPDGLLEE